MNTEELKMRIMKLWKSTFHDSDAYLSLIFDNYFDPDLVEYHEENGQIVSALLGVPYDFGGDGLVLKGLYLCGLATANEFRHRGIMNDLLDRINDKAKARGYSFTFLIPADKSLINYYSVRKYEIAMYRVENRYTELHDFEKDYRSNLVYEDERISQLKSNFYDSLGIEILHDCEEENIQKIIKFISDSEHKISTYVTLIHSIKDIELVIRENAVSKGKIFISLNKENILTGVAFITIDDRRRVHIPKVYYDDQGSLYKLLDAIKLTYPDSPISLYSYPEECDRKALWDKVYGASNPDGGMLGGVYGVSERVYNVGYHAKPYGMIRILDLREILKFIAEYRNDSKFSILVKGNSDDGMYLKCDIRDGRAEFETLEDPRVDKIIREGGVTVLREHELVDIIFRKKGSSGLIQEAFGIPRIPLNMSLLLD